MKVSRFEDLEVWQEARILNKLIFEFTLRDNFSKDYKFSGQIRAASGSIMDNIAEGFERNGNKEFIQFLSIAKGSCGETRSQCYRAYDCAFISQDVLDELLEKATNLSKKISKFISYLKESDFKGQKYM